MDPYVGEIRLFAGRYAPRGWAFCQGQEYLIQQQSLLFAVIGNSFGGNGQTTFKLPDFTGMVPIHQGSGPGLTPRNYTSKDGVSTVTLLEPQIPNHTHTISAQTTQDKTDPTDAIWANEKRGSLPVYSQVANTSLNPQSISATGGTQPHNNMQPYLALNYIIALEGVFPPKQS